MVVLGPMLDIVIMQEAEARVFTSVSSAKADSGGADADEEEEEHGKSLLRSASPAMLCFIPDLQCVLCHQLNCSCSLQAMHPLHCF